MNQLTIQIRNLIASMKSAISTPGENPEMPKIVLRKALAHLERVAWTMTAPVPLEERLRPSAGYLQQALERQMYLVNEINDYINQNDAYNQANVLNQGLAHHNAQMDQQAIESIRQGSITTSIEDQNTIHVCKCEMRSLLMHGCKCGGK